jgi:quercetin dioxygenase-like cupin family protein
MSQSNHRAARATQSALVVSLLALFAATPAFAGECPANKVGANPLAGAPTKPVGVKDMEIASIDLAGENVKLSQRRLRMRQMEIAPGGIVPLHDHADRPALIMVVEGEIYENSSKCLTPILHKPGEVSREFLGVMHWWKNSGTKTVKLTIADIVNDKKPETMMDHM